MSLRILVAHGHEFIRRGIRAFADHKPGWQIVAEASTGREAVALSRQHGPDVVILHINMPDLHGFEATRQIVASRVETRVLLLSGGYTGNVADMVAAGAHGYIHQSASGDEFAHAVTAVSEGISFYRSCAPAMPAASPTANQSPAQEPAALSIREREVLRLLAEGKSNKEISSALDISVRTVETHRSKMMMKLNIHSIAALVRYAIQQNVA